MRNLCYALLILICGNLLGAQAPVKRYRLDYTQLSNGEPTNRNFSIYQQGDWVHLTPPSASKQYHFNLVAMQAYSLLGTKTDTVYSRSDIEPRTDFKVAGENILEYPTRYMKFKYYSNTVEVWYTEASQAKGSPGGQYMPNGNSLVLQVIVNGDRGFRILDVKEVASQKPFELTHARLVEPDEYKAVEIRSRYTILPVFDEETINFDKTLSKPHGVLKSDTVYRLHNGNVILKRIEIGAQFKNAGKVFADLECASTGDSYDRTATLFAIPVYEEGQSERASSDKAVNWKENLPAQVEWMRFMTSFGAGHYNEKRPISDYQWENAAHFKKEITNLLPFDAKAVYIGVFVGNYDKGGHKVSLDLNIHPKVDNTNTNNYIDPLFTTINPLGLPGGFNNKMFLKDSLRVQFTIPENIKRPMLVYTTTGHGGWSEGDEFEERKNTIRIDGKEIFSVYPWREDCATYREYNPASGNFRNGISSSDLSRSNWCPGTQSVPYYIPLDHLAPGTHELELSIDQGPHGKSGNTSWIVSGVVVGKK